MDIDDEDEKKKLEELKAESVLLSKHVIEALGGDVEKALISSRMADPPCMLLTSEYGWSANREQIMKAQALRDSSMTLYLASGKTMEINPKHSILTKLEKKAVADKSENGETGLEQPTVVLYCEAKFDTAEEETKSLARAISDLFGDSK